MAQLACNNAEPGFPKTQKYMKHKDDILSVKITIKRKTGYLEKSTKKDSCNFMKALPLTFARNNLFCLQLYEDFGAINVMFLLIPRYQGHSLLFQ